MDITDHTEHTVANYPYPTLPTPSPALEPFPCSSRCTSANRSSPLEHPSSSRCQFLHSQFPKSWLVSLRRAKGTVPVRPLTPGRFLHILFPISHPVLSPSPSVSFAPRQQRLSRRPSVPYLHPTTPSSPGLYPYGPKLFAQVWPSSSCPTDYPLTHSLTCTHTPPPRCASSPPAHRRTFASKDRFAALSVGTPSRAGEAQWALSPIGLVLLLAARALLTVLVSFSPSIYS